MMYIMSEQVTEKLQFQNFGWTKLLGFCFCKPFSLLLKNIGIILEEKNPHYSTIIAMIAELSSDTLM